MREINPTVRVVGHYAGKDQKLEAASAVHPGASPLPRRQISILDLGPYALDKAETVSLDNPPLSRRSPPTASSPTSAHGVTRGDGPNDLAPEHAESQRLADVLNRLAANKLDRRATFALQTVPVSA